MQNLQTPQMGANSNGRRELDDMRLHVEKMALRAGIRPEAEQAGQVAEHCGDAGNLRGVC